MRCPKCNSRSLIADYDDMPGRRVRALLCVSCGKRVTAEVQKPPATTGRSPRR
jgi:DNA-directed RNA polymerase subunit RPC12/RpoP